MGKRKTGQGTTEMWFAPDSNFFLQCKKPEELDWSLVTQATRVNLIVLRTVQKEIDELKGQGNGRRAQRARTAASLFRRIVNSDTETIVLREEGPGVAIGFGPRLTANQALPAELDLDINDDRIVAQALATATITGNPIFLLTDDSGAMRTSKEVGLPFVAIPEEWQLPPEPDAATREIAELKRRVGQLEGRAPDLKVIALVEGKIVTRVDGEVDYFPPPSAPFIEETIRKTLDTHPRKGIPQHGLGVTIYRQEDVARYRTEYDQWVSSLSESMELLHLVYNATLTPYVVELHFANNGAASAEELIVDISTSGPIRLVREGAQQALQPKGQVFKNPPAPPNAFAIGIPSILGHQIPSPFRIPNIPTSRRHPRAFSWHFDDPESASLRCRGECEEFRHGLDGYSLSLGLRSAPGETGVVTGLLTIRVSARNLPDPRVMSIPVRLGRTDGLTETQIRGQLYEDLSVYFT